MRRAVGECAWEALGSPRYIVAPMVDGSDAAFRTLCQRYGAELSYAPMLHARIFSECKVYRRKAIDDLRNGPKPVVAQICGNDPQIMLKAGKMIQDECDMLDINLGCPQNIAKRGHYGAFLLADLARIVEIVETLTEGLSIPVSCKIRIHGSREETVEMAVKLEAAGCKLLTVHGRTKEQNRQFVGPADWETIRQIKQALSIPVLVNGGIETIDDVDRALEYTGCEGVMVAEAVLATPQMFQRGAPRSLKYALEYLELAKELGTIHKLQRIHFIRMSFPFLSRELDLRNQLNECDLRELAEKLHERVALNGEAHYADSPSWYNRHTHLRDSPHFQSPKVTVTASPAEYGGIEGLLG